LGDPRVKDERRTKVELLEELASRRRQVEALQAEQARHQDVELTLQESEERYRALFEQAADSIVLIDPETGALVEFNDRAHQALGYTRREFEKLRIPDFDIVESPEEVVAHIEKIVREGSDVFETKQRAKSGEIRDVQINARAISIRGKVFTQSIWRDITERRRAEQALRESEERYRALFEQAADSIVLIDTETGALVEFNDRAHQDLGYTREEFQQLRIPDFEILESLEEVAAHIEKIGREGSDDFETKHRTKSGEIRDVHVTSRAVSIRGKAFVQSIWRDITERRRAEEALRESEERYRVLFEQAADSIVLVDPETGALVQFNDRAHENLGCTREEFEKLTLADFEVLESPEAVAAHMQKVAQEGSDDFESKHRTKTGEIRDVQVTTRTISIRGKVFIQSIWHDITERKRAEAALRESEQRFQQVAENAQESIWEVDANGLYTYASPSLERILGYKPEEIVGKIHFYDLFHPEDREELKTAALEVFAQKRYFREFINRNLHKDGETVWLSTSGVPLLDPKGDLLGYRGADTDITERRRAEAALRESEERFKSILDNAVVGIYRTTPDGRILMANPELVRMLGHSSFEELAQRNLEEKAYEPQYPRAAFKERIERDGKVIGLEATWLRRDGTPVFIRESAVAVRDDAGQTLYYEGTVEDITERKQAEERVLEYQQQLRSLASELALTEERERRRMAAYLHDHISQDLAVAKMELDALHKSVPPEVGRCLDEARRLVEQTLEDTRSLTFELSPPVLYELGFEPAVQWLVDHFQEQHGMQFDFEDDGQTKPLAEDVRGILFQAVREAFVNILKHAEAEQVTITARLDGENICVCIRDDGVGFDLAEIGSRTGRERGFGLFNIRERLRHLGGRLEIRSSPGKGTEMTLWAPLRQDGSAEGTAT